MLHHADDSSFAREILQHPGLVLVEFFTTSCAPCRQLEPHLRSIAECFAGQVKIVKVDSEESRGASKHYGVRMAPTFIMFRDGQPLDSIQGAPPPSRLTEFVQSFER